MTSQWREAFIRAYIQRADPCIYEASFAQFFSANEIGHTELADCILQIFVEDVGICELWPAINADLKLLCTGEGGSPRLHCVKVMQTTQKDALICAALHAINVMQRTPICWMPVKSIARAIAHEAPSAATYRDVVPMIKRGCYDALTIAARTIDLARCARGTQHEEIAQSLLERTKDSIPTDPIAQSIRRFVVFMMLRAYDPRGHMVVERPTAPKASPSTISGDDVDRELICALSEQMTAILPNDLADRVIDIARQPSGSLTRAEERELARYCALFCDPCVPIARAKWKLMAQLRANIFIGFDGEHRIIISGPFDCVRIRTCLNVARLAQECGVPRNNAKTARVETVMATGDSSTQSDAPFYFVFGAPVLSIPNRLPRVPDIMRLARRLGSPDRDAQTFVRAFISNCIWRYIMGFRGSASADILAVEDEGLAIIAYGEDEICAQSASRAHKIVREELARDAAFYVPLAEKWGAILSAHIAIEQMAERQYDMRNGRRSQLVGISVEQLTQCAARANALRNMWSV